MAPQRLHQSLLEELQLVCCVRLRHLLLLLRRRGLWLSSLQTTRKYLKQSAAYVNCSNSPKGLSWKTQTILQSWSKKYIYIYKNTSLYTDVGCSYPSYLCECLLTRFPSPSDASGELTGEEAWLEETGLSEVTHPFGLQIAVNEELLKNSFLKVSRLSNLTQSNAK